MELKNEISLNRPDFVQSKNMKTIVNHLNFKIMKTKKLVILLIAIFFISSASWAQRPMRNDDRPMKKPMIMKRNMQRNTQKENFLSDEQKEAVKKIRLETAKEIKPLKNELNELQARQNTLTTADNTDLKAINKNIDKMSEVKAEMAKILAKQHQEVRSLLTEEQRLKMDNRKNRLDRKQKPFIRNRPENRETPRFGRGA